MKTESVLKAMILSKGVDFTEKALFLAKKYNAKGQNLCYNLPSVANSLIRPQELLLTNQEDGYSTLVSCVAPHAYRSPLLIDANETSFFIASDERDEYEKVNIDVVQEPEFYTHILSNGVSAKEYVSACGYDELNILPWSGCAISTHCAFCGIEKVTSIHRCNKKLTAHEISKRPSLWNKHESDYLTSLKEALVIAKQDPIYSEHLHPIMISGNLSDDLLDFEAEIFSRIAMLTYEIIKNKMSEGIVAVIEPPPSDSKLYLMRASNISTVVFNMEVANEPWVSEYCPGKNNIFPNYVYKRLQSALPVFGYGNVWTNFVLGLEPLDGLVAKCTSLAKQGIVPSANVFHCDLGSRLKNFSPPETSVIIDFFCQLAEIYKTYKVRPFYCEKALRTSLSNEAYNGRLNND